MQNIHEYFKKVNIFNNIEILKIQKDFNWLNQTVLSSLQACPFIPFFWYQQEDGSIYR